MEYRWNKCNSKKESSLNENILVYKPKEIIPQSFLEENKNIEELIIIPEVYEIDDVSKITQLTNLKLLYLQSIKEIPSGINELINLTHLEIHLSEFEKIPEEICQLIKLKTLVLTKCDIIEIPECINNLIHLNVLNLSHNKISSISNLNLGITVLDLSNNSFNEEILDINNLVKLKTLDLSNCFISKPPIFKINLESLYMSNNNIHKFPELKDLKNLENLDLSNNYIKKIPADICKFKLDNFIMSNNFLTKISCLPDAVCIDLGYNDLIKIPCKNLTRIKYLRLSHNKLKNIPKCLGLNQPNLISLDLSYNKLNDLSNNILKPKGIKLHLDGNPWKDLSPIFHQYLKVIPKTILTNSEEPNFNVFKREALDTETLNWNNIYEYLKNVEVQERIPPDYLDNQRDINSECRKILIDWMIKVHRMFHMSLDEIFQAVYILDKYSSLTKTQIKRSKYQLIGSVCMLIANKLEAFDYGSILLQDLVYVSDDSFTWKDIEEMEIKILRTLNYELLDATIIIFLHRFNQIAKFDSSQKKLALQYATKCLPNYEILNYLPSLVASSIVYIINKSWDDTLTQAILYTEKDMEKCVETINLIVLE